MTPSNAQQALDAVEAWIAVWKQVLGGAKVVNRGKMMIEKDQLALDVMTGHHQTIRQALQRELSGGWMPIETDARLRHIIKRANFALDALREENIDGAKLQLVDIEVIANSALQAPQPPPKDEKKI
jgi:hypothetical protein